MSGFFTLPKSQRKRKREAPTSSTAQSKPNKKPKPVQDDESISGSDSDGAQDLPTPAASDDDNDDARETAAERRLRLAEKYLEDIRAEVGEDAAGFDAVDVDRELIAARLKEDVDEAKARMHNFIAKRVQADAAQWRQFRADTVANNAIAIHGDYIYTASSDMRLIKWKLPANGNKIKQVLYTRGDTRKKGDLNHKHHTARILCLAVSGDGNFVVSGGADSRLIVWRSHDLSPVRVFTQHRAAVTALAFRGSTPQLFSASRDRTVKVWNIAEPGPTYADTLFGHQDEVVDVSAVGGAQERCVSVGSRDRSARVWKVVEESQLVFRGGGTAKQSQGPSFVEGSLDRVVQIDTSTFVTGSDSGAISLFKHDRKKALHVLGNAHGYDAAPTDWQSSADAQDEAATAANSAGATPTPRWITALAGLPGTDLVASGSWDGYVRLWRVVADDKGARRLETAGKLGEPGNEAFAGIVNDLALSQRDAKGPGRTGRKRDGPILVAAAISREPRLGQWTRWAGSAAGKATAAAMVWEVPLAAPKSNKESNK